jgi:hypothetical protein
MSDPLTDIEVALRQCVVEFQRLRGGAMTPTDMKALEALRDEMRAIGMPAGQCPTQGLSVLASSMAAAEAERCFRWAQGIDAILQTTSDAV